MGLVDRSRSLGQSPLMWYSPLDLASHQTLLLRLPYKEPWTLILLLWTRSSLSCHDGLKSWVKTALSFSFYFFLKDFIYYYVYRVFIIMYIGYYVYRVAQATHICIASAEAWSPDSKETIVSSPDPKSLFGLYWQPRPQTSTQTPDAVGPGTQTGSFLFKPSQCFIPVTQYSGGRGKRITMNQKPAWATSQWGPVLKHKTKQIYTTLYSLTTGQSFRPQIWWVRKFCWFSRLFLLFSYFLFLF